MTGKLDMVRADDRCMMEVLDIWLDAAGWIKAQRIEQWMPERFELSEVEACMTGGRELFLLRENGIAAGTFYMEWEDDFAWPDGQTASSGYIHRLAVGRRHHGRGLGAAMLRWAEHYAAVQGKEKIRLDCIADNPRLDRYYRELGYQFLGRVDTKQWGIHLYQKPAQLAEPHADPLACRQ